MAHRMAHEFFAGCESVMAEAEKHDWARPNHSLLLAKVHEAILWLDQEDNIAPSVAKFIREEREEIASKVLKAD